MDVEFNSMRQNVANLFESVLSNNRISRSREQMNNAWVGKLLAFLDMWLSILWYTGWTTKKCHIHIWDTVMIMIVSVFSLNSFFVILNVIELNCKLFHRYRFYHWGNIQECYKRENVQFRIHILPIYST